MENQRIKKLSQRTERVNYIKNSWIAYSERLTLHSNCYDNIVQFKVLVFPRKEVIQPQVPLRLPCYDLVPVTELTVGRRLPKVGNPTSGTPGFHHLTGGVYKAQEHIHRVIADTRLLAIPTSCRRVVSLQSELRRSLCDLLHLAVLRRFVCAIVARVKPWA